MFEIHKNFIDEEHFEVLEKVMMGNDFPWFYNKAITQENNNKRFQFVHTFYNDCTWTSNHYQILGPIINKLKIFTLKRIKANLITKTAQHDQANLHIDYDKCTTAIYYVNTNNGYTIFENGEKIDCIANSIVIFDSDYKHASVSQTDTNTRVVINFNFVKNEN